MRWSRVDDQIPNDKSEYIIAKTIAAFMNAEGGSLFVGVNDDGEVVGLEDDYQTFSSEKNKDGFLLALDDLVQDFLGKEYKTFMIPEIIEIDDKQVCVIEVTDSTRPVYVQKNNEEQFFVRFGASTRQMTTREASEYIEDNWS